MGPLIRLKVYQYLQAVSRAPRHTFLWPDLTYHMLTVRETKFLLRAEWTGGVAMPYQHYNDAELVALLNQGNESAFESIYSRYAKTLFGFARRTISAKEDCEEIIQDVFVSLWERRASLHVLSLKYYLLNAVRYKVIRYIQHHKVKMKYAEHYRLFEAMYASLDEDERSPELIQSRLMNIIADLPERCQTAIQLRLLENLTNGEIAQRMSITKKTVEVYMLRAFDHFRASYDKIYHSG